MGDHAQKTGALRTAAPSPIDQFTPLRPARNPAGARREESKATPSTELPTTLSWRPPPEFGHTAVSLTPP